MTPPTQAPNTTNGYAPWRDLALGLTTVLLLLVAVGHMYFVVPSYRVAVQGAGTVLSLPSRLAISISHFGALITALGVLGLAVAWWRDRRGSAGLFPAALAIAALICAAYLALVSCVYLDYARIMGRFH